MKRILNFIDTETTGFDAAGGDRMVELGVVRYAQDGASYEKIAERLWRFDPERDMPEEAFSVHGLSRAYLANFRPFRAAATEIVAFLSETPAGAEPVLFIAHNAAFDASFVNAEMQRAGVDFRIRMTDSLERARTQIRDGRHSLDALARRFEVSIPRHLHGALVDASILAEVWRAMDHEEVRRATFDLSGPAASPGEVASGEPAPRFARPAIRRIRIGEADAARHEAGVEKLPNAVWRM